MDKRVVATWSGGIDSTAVVANLLVGGWAVQAVTLEFGSRQFVDRERRAREALAPELRELGSFAWETRSADWLWAFSPDGEEIPTRNRRIIDHLIARDCIPQGITNLAMGEYIGCDTWVVRDHVGAADCDARSLTAYIYEQYGIGYRLLTLADFGESRYKVDRLRLGWGVLGEIMGQTTNCLHGTASGEHCGKCYKCLERHASFEMLGERDPTRYEADPGSHPRYPLYLAQMAGEDISASMAEFA